MKYRRKNKTQVSYGEAIGILLLDSPVPFIPGDVANATSYPFPVRFKKVAGFSVEKALAKDPVIYPNLLAAAKDLAANGVRAVTGDCGFMALHQKKLKQDLDIPVCLSSLFQIPFIRHFLPQDKDQDKYQAKQIGIITASAQSLTPDFLEEIGIPAAPAPGRSETAVPGHAVSDQGIPDPAVSDAANRDLMYPDLIIKGLETCPEFSSAALAEKGTLDDALVREEVVQTAMDMVREKNIGAILLECSLLPPYAAAVHDATGLPVFDYLTMINFIFSAVVPRTYDGFM